MKWVTSGFEEFRQGTFGNGGQNIYVSKAGVLQRIHQTDINRNGYIDLLFCNSQEHEERVPIYIYADPFREPEKHNEIYIGGASDAVVADFTGNGTQDVAWSCVWDGMTQLNQSCICFASDMENLGKYVRFIPANGSRAVAAGDFDGDGKCDVVFFTNGSLKFFWQDEIGLCSNDPVTIPIGDVKRLLAYKFPADETATLFISRDDGSVEMIKGDKDRYAQAPEPVRLFDADPDYVKIEHSWDSYTQAVPPTKPRLDIVKIDGKDFFVLFRKSRMLLYPCLESGFGEALEIDCREGIAVAAGDIYNRGVTDLVVITHDGENGKDSSYIYLGGYGSFSNDHRLVIPTGYANDVALGKFTGEGLDIIIAQGHTMASFDNDLLLFATGSMTSPGLPRPQYLPGHDVQRIVVLKDSSGKDRLFVGNVRSGSFIGVPDNDIYFGSASGYHQNDHIGLPGWGTVDSVCCDFNDDGRPDIGLANNSELAPWLDRGSYIYYQNADGTFDRDGAVRVDTIRAHGVVCGDLNHNGYLDLVFSCADHPGVRVFYGSAEGFKPEDMVEISTVDGDKVYRQPRFIGLADLNGNGYLDLILSQITSEESIVLWGGPDGFDFKNRQSFRVHHSCCCKVADLNGNGYPDLIWGGHSPTPGKPNDAFIYIYWGSAEGYSENRCTMLPSVAVNSMAVADFNNDGLLDIFVGSYQNEKERDLPSFIYWNSPTGFSEKNRSELPTHAVSGCLAADFDGDGYIDIAVANHKVNGDHIAYSTVWYNGPDGFDPKRTQNLSTKGSHGMYGVDPGNIMDRSFYEYYTSAVHEIPENSGVSKIYWDAEIPRKCGVYAQFRVADSPEELENAEFFGPMGRDSWFDAYDYVEIPRFTGKYIQYKLALYAYNALSTPRIKSVTVEFEKL